MPLGFHLHICLVPPHCSSSPFQCLPPRPRTTTRCCSSYNPRRQIRLLLPPLKSRRLSDQDLLQSALSSLADGGSSKTHLPAVRTYESDLVRLTLVGDVDYDQALTAAAADGGDAAQEHLEFGTPTMVVETLFPGSTDENSTTSTRLFLPAAEVKDRAKNLKSRTTAALLSQGVSRNVLAMTFRQVILQRAWSFELEMFPPETERDMDDLPNPREISSCCRLSSSEPKILAGMAEAVCSFALNNVGKEGFDTVSTEFGMHVSKLPASQIMMKAKSILETSKFGRWKLSGRERTLKHKWWAPPSYPKLEKSLGSGVGSWVNEYIPAYKIQIDGASFMDARFQGWQQSQDNKQEVLLTYFQMAELANILDMLYEDRFTTPNKNLSYGLVAKIPKRSSNKNSLWNWTLKAVVSGCFLLAFGVLTRFYLPTLFVPKEALGKHITACISNVDSRHTLSLEEDKLESLCVSIIQNIKDTLQHDGDIMAELATGAWIGEIPDCLKKSNNDADQATATLYDQGPTPYRGEEGEIIKDMSTNRQSSSETERSQMSSSQDVASYQVVLSKYGKIIGFQPTNRMAVNHWGANPLTKILYNGRMPAPSLVEPSLKIPQPEGVVLIELFMSVNSKSWFALARPLRY